MNWYKPKRPFYKKKRYAIPLTILLLLVFVRVIAPPIMLAAINDYLEDFSPTLHLKASKLKLGILRGAYTVAGIKGKIKDSDQEFLDISEVDVSVPWKDIFRGRIAANVKMTGMDFTYSDALMPAVKQHLAYMEEQKDPEAEVKELPIPLRVNRFDLKDSRVRLAGYPKLTKEENIAISHLEGRVTNLIPDDEHVKSLFNFNGNVLKTGNFKTVGELNLQNDPPQWKVDGELQSFKLTEVNPFLRENVPVTFDSGELDVYAEAIGTGGESAEGYIKPFMKNVKVLGSPDDFKNVKHWMMDVLTAASTGLVKESKTDTVATEVPFKFDGEMKIEATEAVLNAVKHGHQQRLTRGVENRYQLQAQEDQADKGEDDEN